jgi:hypothetical protein
MTAERANLAVLADAALTKHFAEKRLAAPQISALSV